ncbi:hypothetical protein D7V94_20860 [Parablautia intestinalis]|uniref:Uncharacterized protein n=2 Tax=Parablautia intestinalis TaxID=2320100 RepID=A0A3A9A800_9FIRM|nr:hypothetical protein D7V94_20860 [Parablautia intestinalis]
MFSKNKRKKVLSMEIITISREFGSGGGRELEIMVFAYNHDIEERDIEVQDMEITVSGKYTSVQKR